MGILAIAIQVCDSAGLQFEETSVTIDTRSTYTTLPRSLLERLDVPVQRTLDSETADGRIIPVQVSETTIYLDGIRITTPVIFAEPWEPSLLGVVALEQASLGVDPITQRLIPVPIQRF